jgi:hypothetical protein
MSVRSQSDNHGRVTYLVAGCKAWRCTYCGPKKAEKLKKAIARAAEDKGLTRFLTLTLDTKNLSDTDLRDGGVAYIRRSWSKLRVYLKREHGKSIDFISIVELQKRRVAHLHILVDRYLPKQWVKSAWVSVGGGQIVDIRFVDVHRVSAYLSKYFAKDSVLGLPPGVRRYSVSHGIKLLPRVKSTWSVEWRSLNWIQEITKKRISEMAWDRTGKLERIVIQEAG